VIPVVLAAVALAILIAVVVIVMKLKRTKSDDWEINYEELDVGEHLGSGTHLHALCHGCKLPRAVSAHVDGTRTQADTARCTRPYGRAPRWR
jgi:hypothetical protein